MAKKLREQPALYQHFDEILATLRGLLVIPPPTTLGSPGPGGGDGELEMTDRLQLYEVCGQLICSEQVPADRQRGHLAAIVTPLLEQVQGIVGDPTLASQPLLIKHLSNTIEACGCLSKGLSQI